jgi:hypothetical protein
MFIEELIANFTVHAFREPILLWLARRNVMPFDPAFLCPLQDNTAGELGTVIADNHFGASASLHQFVKLTNNTQPRQRGIHRQR